MSGCFFFKFPFYILSFVSWFYFVIFFVLSRCKQICNRNSFTNALMFSGLCDRKVYVYIYVSLTIYEPAADLMDFSRVEQPLLAGTVIYIALFVKELCLLPMCLLRVVCLFHFGVCTFSSFQKTSVIFQRLAQICLRITK